MPRPSKQRADRAAAAGRLAHDWLPPKVIRGVRRLRAGKTPTLLPLKLEPVDLPEVATDPRITALTERTLAGLETCDPVYRPTNFWGPGVDRLLREMDSLGIDSFKSWPEAFFWFYPIYGKRVRASAAKQMTRVAETGGAAGAGGWLRSVLASVPEARRDFDVARMAWDQARWPMDLESHGESAVGKPTQTFKLVDGNDNTARLTKPYLNYLLCLAGLSRHVSEPPRSFLELGGGYGTLGEIVLARDPEARYVNCDIPPLLSISSYYLTRLFGDERVLTYDDRVADTGPIEVPRSACLPNWRIADLVGDFDVFVNSFSFQEMEPAVVEQYADAVAALRVGYVVSLNSRRGKPIAVGDQVGVKQQVVSSTIVELFERRGYELCATYNRPLLVSQGELAILKRR
jgi:putative sugar O-methyltransferase